MLDLGAGTDEQSLALAGQVDPTGSVVATDLSAAMLQLPEGTPDPARVRPDGPVPYRRVLVSCVNLAGGGLPALRAWMEADSDIGAIAIVGLGAPGDRQRALAEGCVAFAPKPLERAALGAALGDLVGRE